MAALMCLLMVSMAIIIGLCAISVLESGGVASAVLDMPTQHRKLDSPALTLLLCFLGACLLTQVKPQGEHSRHGLVDVLCSVSKGHRVVFTGQSVQALSVNGQ